MDGNSIEAVILTKSIKHGGFCVAGIDINTGKWVRLITSDEDSRGAVRKSDMRYEGGGYCQILDVVSVQGIVEAPSELQPENLLFDRSSRWRKLKQYKMTDVLNIHPEEKPNVILGNRYPYIAAERVSGLRHSLTLIKVENLILAKQRNLEGELRTKASFIHNRIPYRNMSVTDSDYFRVPDGFQCPNAYLVLSLPDSDYNGNYYKFIARIFPD